MSQYKRISDFGQGVRNTSENPLNYCLADNLNTMFNNGATGNTISNSNGANCQAFMSDYCANDWNTICETASKSSTTMTPNSLQTCGSGYGQSCVQPCNRLTAGEILIANTATKKYLSQMAGCSLKYEPFDPTVAGSPLVSFWSGNCNTHGNETCIPVYEVNPKIIDNDPVMNKILNKPIIAWGLLVNIYNTAVRKNTIDSLRGTKLYNFFQLPMFQDYIKLSKMSLTPKMKRMVQENIGTGCCN